MYRLTSEQQAIVSKSSEISVASIAPHAAAVDEESRYPHEAMDALAAAGFWGLIIPAEFGGMGQSLRVAAAVLDEIAQHCASTAMVYMMHLAGINCYLAEPEKMGPHLRAAAAGQHLSTLAFSEKGSRSHFWAPVSRAVTAGDDQVTLSAAKSWVTSAGIADGIVASCGAVSGEGASVFLVMKDDHGVSVSGAWNSMGMRGNQSAPMTFKDVPLSISARRLAADGAGSDIMLGKALPVFQICQGGIGVGLAEAAFKAASSHMMASKFEHLGTKLSDLPNLRASLATMRLETDKARAYLVSAVDRVEHNAPDAMLHVLAVKASSGETAVTVTDLAMRVCGGAAFSKHLGLERVFRDARAAIVMAPTTDHLKEFVGRALVGLPLFG